MSTYGLWLSAAGMQVQEHRQTLLANNMANAQTTGFKHDLAVVTRRRVESQASAGAFPFAHSVLDAMPGGVSVRQTFQTFAQGPIELTGRPLDVAIEGDGFFAVSDGDVTRYTRDGEFARSTVGELILKAGDGRWKVLSDTGQVIRLEEELGEPYVAGNGTIRQGRTVIAKLGLVTTEDKQSLRKIGANLFELRGGAEMVAADGRLVPESREGATFEAINGLAEMIEASRAHEINAKLLQIQDSLSRQAVSTLGRLR